MQIQIPPGHESCVQSPAVSAGLLSAEQCVMDFNENDGETAAIQASLDQQGGVRDVSPSRQAKNSE